MKTETIPAFNPATAKAVEPTRHEPTGRTYAFVQAGALFSATGDFIAIQSPIKSGNQEIRNKPLSS